jgi:ubiquitin carboxyl-terminal hydrolase 5/13
MNNELKDLVEKYASEVKVATQNDKVYKDECVYSFETPESETGLFVCLQTFICVAKQYLDVHHSKTKSHLFLRIKTTRKELVKEEEINEPEKKKPSKFGIGIEGGFDINEKQFVFEHEYALFVYPEQSEIKLDERNLNEHVLNERVRKSIESIIKSESITQKEDLASQAASWDGEKRIVSKHSANLTQTPNPTQISPNPTSWKCEVCGITNNLWLNLTDGRIFCGRRQLDGSGGNNHAVEHYQKTKYPLAAKLGTITGQGADVYSYDEDEMVEDSNLAVHLAHFGINMNKMEKTEKTMAELEIDLNQKIGEWDRIQETGSKVNLI